jgi:hypothetical protein
VTSQYLATNTPATTSVAAAFRVLTGTISSEEWGATFIVVDGLDQRSVSRGDFRRYLDSWKRLEVVRGDDGGVVYLLFV